MILPTKHIDISRSIFRLGSELLRIIDKPRNVSFVWESANTIPEVRTFQRFTLTLDFLYSIGAIDFENGYIKRMK